MMNSLSAAAGGVSTVADTEKTFQRRDAEKPRNQFLQLSSCWACSAPRRLGVEGFEESAALIG